MPSLLLPTALAALVLATAAGAAERVLIDDGWRFHLGDSPEAAADHFDASSWRVIDLPHDWSVEHPTDPSAPSAGGGGFHRTGVGWYRRELPPRPAGEFWRIDFEGVYRHAEVWLNGQRLGEHAYGYTPFSFELTDVASTSETNTVAVRVDNSQQPNSRWYSGSGIYRHVWLRRSGAQSIDQGSLWLRTNSISAEGARATVACEVRNRAPTPRKTTLELSLRDGEGVQVAQESRGIRVGATASAAVELALDVADARPWSPDAPHLYTLEAVLLDAEGKTIDRVSQRVGLRTIEVDAEQGFLLNGESLLLVGGNVHHDHGILGAASYDDAERRRARLLKEAGFNAVRTSHNPPAEAFLDACDEAGLLVIDEAFDGWRKHKVARDYGDDFDANWRDDLRAMVRRDRRHASVAMWSLGNEMYERGEPGAIEIASEGAAIVRSLDGSRPVTAGVNGLGKGKWNRLDPLFATLDAAGYNYETPRFDDDHARVPDRVMYSSESYLSDTFVNWRAVTERPWVVGDFVWSAIDYLGESGIGRFFPPGEEPRAHWVGDHYPWRGAACGDIDLLGDRKPVSHYRNVVWDRGQTLYAWVVEPVEGERGTTLWATEPGASSWTWDVEPGTALTVRVASRWPRVRLELNGEPLGVKPTGIEQEFLAEYVVPYEPGELVAVGLDHEGAEHERCRLTTAQSAAGIKLRANRTEATADGQSLVFIDAHLIDESGTHNPLGDRRIEFAGGSTGRIVASGNADLTNTEAYASHACETHRGRAQCVVRSTGEPGVLTLTATAEGLPPASVTIHFSK